MRQQLKFPDFGIVPTGISPTSIVTQAHISFLRDIQMDPEVDTDKIHQKAVAEVAAIRLFFPDVRTEAIQICMAAWLSTLCTIDDILEEMDPPAAEAALGQSIEIVLGQNELDLKVYLTPHKNQVAFIMTRLRNYCSHHLTVPTAEDFLAEVANVCKGLVSELDYRGGSSTGLGKRDLSTYLQIRVRTIGIGPFFALIRHLYCSGSRKQADMIGLQRAVSLAAGLQNDLIGLEKDLRNGESMNAVVVALRDMGREASDQNCLREATCRVTHIHNECVEAIFMMLEGWNKNEFAGMADEVSCCRVIAAFVESHMKWCASAKRYQLTI